MLSKPPFSVSDRGDCCCHQGLPLSRQLHDPSAFGLHAQARHHPLYVTHKLFPKGLRPEMPCVEDWALRCGVSLKRLVARSGKFGFHAILQVCSVHGELSLNEVQTSWIPTWKLACALKVARFRRLMKRAPCKSKTKQLGALKAFAVENSWPRPAPWSHRAVRESSRKT